MCLPAIYVYIQITHIFEWQSKQQMETNPVFDSTREIKNEREEATTKQKH